MRKRSIANLLSRNCKRGLDRKWKLPERRRLRQARQFRKERKRLSLTPSSQFFNQRLDPVGPSTIRWPHQWPRARCVLRAVRWDDKSYAEFWEEFSEAVVAGDSVAVQVRCAKLDRAVLCSMLAMRRSITFSIGRGAADPPRKIAECFAAHPAI